MCGQIRSALHCWARRAGVTQSNFIKVGLSHQGWNQRWVAKRKTFSWFKDQPTNRNRNTSVHNYEYCETTHWTQIFPFDTKWSFFWGSFIPVAGSEQCCITSNVNQCHLSTLFQSQTNFAQITKCGNQVWLSLFSQTLINQCNVWGNQSLPTL